MHEGRDKGHQLSAVLSLYGEADIYASIKFAPLVVQSCEKCSYIVVAFAMTDGGVRSWIKQALTN